jgi:hypothetical protein
MKSDPDLTLETDRLEQLLETPPEPQSVVVVEYRNRGVPTWIFFPLIFMVPLGAIIVYHRTVTERYRVEAAQTRQSLDNLAAKGGASAPNVGAGNAAPTPNLFIVGSGDSQTSPTSAGHAQVAALASDGVDGTPVATASSAPSPGGPAVSLPPAHTGTTNSENPVAAESVAPPPDAQANRRITMRSVLPNPFADGGEAPLPPAPGEGPASRPAGPGEQTSPVAGQSEPGPRPPTQEQVHNDPQPVNELASRDERLAPQAPLPSKEESLRQIEEEAAKLRAESLVQVENKVANQRSQRIADQIKFHDELREAIRSFGYQAGPEIEKIAKRYDGEINPVNWAKARQAWRFSRLSQSGKVKYVRDLELPEVAILEFLCSDLDPQIKKRGGPRNQNEVRVRAASQLLKYAFPGTDASPRTGGAVTDAPAARTQASSTTNGAARP